MDRKLKKGDRVDVDTPQGRTAGVVHKVVTKETKVRGTRLDGSEDEPIYVVRCDRQERPGGPRDVIVRRRP